MRVSSVRRQRSWCNVRDDCTPRVIPSNKGDHCAGRVIEQYRVDETDEMSSYLVLQVRIRTRDLNPRFRRFPVSHFHDCDSMELHQHQSKTSVFMIFRCDHYDVCNHRFRMSSLLLMAANVQGIVMIISERVLCCFMAAIRTDFLSSDSERAPA